MVLNYKASILAIMVVIHIASAIELIPVLDTEGNPVMLGEPYSIVSANPGQDQGHVVMFEEIQDYICPEAVTLTRFFSLLPGFPIGFYPALLVEVQNQGEVFVLENITLKFFHPSGCNAVSSVWRANQGTNLPTGVVDFLSIGGDLDKDHFRINLSNVNGTTNYKLLHCSVKVCHYVGIYNQDGVPRLALVTDDVKPFEFSIIRERVGSN